MVHFLTTNHSPVPIEGARHNIEDLKKEKNLVKTDKPRSQLTVSVIVSVHIAIKKSIKNLLLEKKSSYYLPGSKYFELYFYISIYVYTGCSLNIVFFLKIFLFF